MKINEKNIKITSQMLSQIAEIDSFKGAWTRSALLEKEQLTKLRKISTIESVGSSNRIEGNKLSDEEVEKLLSRISINRKSFKSRDEEEATGYAKLMDTVFDNYSIIPLSENYIKQLHQTLLQFVSKDERHRGEYKKLPNSVAAYDVDGKEIGIIFETASPFDTPRYMQELIDWTQRNLNDPYYHPLIIIGLFIVHFLAIHPFQDGNGRLSRVLTILLLLKAGYSYVPYSSIESIVEAGKEGYYIALRQTQKNIFSENENIDYEPWLSYFLTILQKQKRHLESKIEVMLKDETKLDPKYKLSKNARMILDLFNDKPEWSVTDISNTLKLNINTTAKTVKMLVENGYITKHGTTKGAWYMLAVE